MSDHDDDLAQVERAAREIVPRLTERLNRHHLGELEVRQGSLRVRVVAGEQAAPPPAAASPRLRPRVGRHPPRLPR